MGQAILHVHTTLSDGTATPEEILERLEQDREVDVVGFTDHDDNHAFEAALRWKAAHPASRVEPIWGVELTIWGFKHLCFYRLTPPFPAHPPRKFLSLTAAVRWAKAAGAFVVVPHVDTVWIGLGSRRLERYAASLGIDGFELLNPYHGSDRNVDALARMNRRFERRHDRPLLAVGGSDAHHLADLYRVIVDFPGGTPADLERAFREHTALPRWGPPSPAPPLRLQLRQHIRALVVHPLEQVCAWARRQLERAQQLREASAAPVRRIPTEESAGSPRSGCHAETSMCLWHTNTHASSPGGLFSREPVCHSELAKDLRTPQRSSSPVSSARRSCASSATVSGCQAAEASVAVAVAVEGFQAAWSRSMALGLVRRVRMQATRATWMGFPAARSRR